MKKVLLILIFALALLSCEHYIEVDPDGPKRELVVNALIASSDTVHYVSVSMSRKDAIGYPEAATLKAYIGDKACDEVSVSELSRREHRIPFHARINAGDEIRLEVAADTLVASVAVEVPASPRLTLLDSFSFVRVNENGSKENCFYAKVRLQDIKGESNRYTFVAFQQVSWVVELAEGSLSRYGFSVGDTLKYTRRFLPIDNSSDPLLGAEISIGNDILTSNSCNLCTDESFQDGSCDLSLIVREPFSGEEQENIFAKDASFIAVPHYDLYLRVLNISQEAFSYYSYLSVQNTLLGSTYLVDYASYPNNVTGALGFVSAGGSAEVFLGRKSAEMILPGM